MTAPFVTFCRNWPFRDFLSWAWSPFLSPPPKNRAKLLESYFVTVTFVLLPHTTEGHTSSSSLKVESIYPQASVWIWFDCVDFNYKIWIERVTQNECKFSIKVPPKFCEAAKTKLILAHDLISLSMIFMRNWFLRSLKVFPEIWRADKYDCVWTCFNVFLKFELCKKVKNGQFPYFNTTM
jgi:hypothetical protein